VMELQLRTAKLPAASWKLHATSLTTSRWRWRSRYNQLPLPSRHRYRPDVCSSRLAAFSWKPAAWQFSVVAVKKVS